MTKSEKRARRLVRQANGLSPGFRYYDNPYEGETMPCPHCEEIMDAGLEYCPQCGQPIPGQQHSREKAAKSAPVVLMILALAALIGLGLYFFARAIVESGFLALLLGP